MEMILVSLTEKEKETLLVKGVRKNTRLGMFLSHEIRSMTDIEIEEIGKRGFDAILYRRVHILKNRMING